MMKAGKERKTQFNVINDESGKGKEDLVQLFHDINDA
jgi:hypothetical protein